jgi:hypothetical protein
MKKEEMLEKKICPRCGGIFSYLEHRPMGGNKYVYAVHVTREGKKRHVKRCYLGPESEYINVTHMHLDEGLILRGLINHDRALEYLKALIEHFRTHELDDDSRRMISHYAKELMKIAGSETGVTPGELETIAISRDELDDLIQYFIARKTKGMSKERMNRAKELFKKVFREGERTVKIGG